MCRQCEVHLRVVKEELGNVVSEREATSQNLCDAFRKHQGIAIFSVRVSPLVTLKAFQECSVLSVARTRDVLGMLEDTRHFRTHMLLSVARTRDVFGLLEDTKHFRKQILVRHFLQPILSGAETAYAV